MSANPAEWFKRAKQHLSPAAQVSSCGLRPRCGIKAPAGSEQTPNGIETNIGSKRGNWEQGLRGVALGDSDKSIGIEGEVSCDLKAAKGTRMLPLIPES